MAHEAAVSHARASFVRKIVVELGHVTVEDSTVERDAAGAKDAVEKYDPTFGRKVKLTNLNQTRADTESSG